MSQAKQHDTVVDFSGQGSIDDQAARWVARLDVDQPSAATLADFKQWVRQSAAHREAFEGYLELWHGMNVATELVPPSRQRALTARFPLPRLAWGLASVLLVALLSLQVLSPANSHYSTAIGEQRQVGLPDGSTALLNTNTRLAVHYSDQRREIHLLQGEAHFEVEKNPDRPFEVFAGKGLVRAVGTAFTVHLRDEDVEVVVTEGVIEIDTVAASTNAGPRLPAPTSTEEQPRVGAGAFATYDRHTAKHILLAELDTLAAKTAWQQGLLMFENEALAHVVAEVGRYTTTKIIIPDKRLREFKVDGQFKVGDTVAMFEALSISFNIRAEAVGDGLVYLVLNESDK